MTSQLRPYRPLVLLVLLVTATGTAACVGGDGRPTSGSSSDSSAGGAGAPPITPPPAGSVAAMDSADAADSASTTPSTGGAARDDAATLRAVRTSPPSAEAVERVVFEFDGENVPRYEIAYAEPPFMQCGSGQPVTIAGGAVLQVRLRGTHAHAESGGEMLATVTERDRKLDQPLLRQLTLTCDFEAEVEWLIGVSVRTPYRVLELQSPARLVVDLVGG